MAGQRATPSKESLGADPAYLHGASVREQARLARRTADTSAAFFLPHLRPGMRMLDCGCGVGSITVGLARAVAPGEAVGIDVQPAQIARARALGAEHGADNARFEVGSVYELPFPDASFDAAFANTLFMHLAEPLRALREMQRVLKPGGVVGIADDDHSTLIWEPRTPLLTALHRLVMQVVAHHGGDGYRARHHPRLLREAGFVRIIAGATLGTGGVWGTAEERRAHAAWTADQIAAPEFVRLVTGEGWADSATLAAMVAAAREWGEHPDAVFALLGVTAVGWVPE